MLRSSSDSMNLTSVPQEISPAILNTSGMQCTEGDRVQDNVWDQRR